MASDRLATSTAARSEGELATYLPISPRSYVGHDVAAKRSTPNSATGSTRPQRTASPAGYHPTGQPRQRSPSSEAPAPSRTRSPVS
jgi:hypothetical protein